MSKFTLADLLPADQDLKLEHPALGVLDFTIKVRPGSAPSVRQKSIETLAWLQSAQKETKPKELAALVTGAEEAAAEAAAEAIVGWSEDAPFGEYSKEAALSLMKKPELAWLRTQVNSFVAKEANFFRSAGE